MRLVEDLTNARLVMPPDCAAFASLDQPDLPAVHCTRTWQPSRTSALRPIWRLEPPLNRRIRSLHALRVPAPDFGR